MYFFLLMCFIQATTSLKQNCAYIEFILEPIKCEVNIIKNGASLRNYHCMYAHGSYDLLLVF